MLPGTHLTRTIARTGIDWIVIDCEHGNIADADMHECVNAAAACGVSPLVRVPAAEGWMVKRVLDAGAHGFMCPLLRTAQDAKSIVETAKFPPIGRRGFGSPFSMGAFASPMQVDDKMQKTPTAVEYLREANESLLTLIQNETKEALENVEAIAEVPGVDVLFVGPFDLGNNIGHPIVTGAPDEVLSDAVQKVRLAAKKAGKKSGIYGTSGEQAKAYATQGFDMVNVTGDVLALDQHVSNALSVAQGGNPSEFTGPYGR